MINAITSCPSHILVNQLPRLETKLPLCECGKFPGAGIIKNPRIKTALVAGTIFAKGNGQTKTTSKIEK